MKENKHMHWASIWGNAVSIAENRPESYSKNITLRYPIHSAFSGDALRLTFDNYCGTDEITIEKTTVRVGAKFYLVTFNNKQQAVIPAGETIVSDPVECSITANNTFLVSFYLKDFTQMRSMVYTSGPLSGGMYAIGDQTENMVIPINISKKTSYTYFLSNISVYTEKKNRAIV
ncbi:MAG: lipase, partial [Lachnospiraceae bacterium]|nr:lipase [Lachnospiraceae bacterium]